MLLLTSPRLAWRSHRLVRRLNRGHIQDSAADLFEIVRELQARPRPPVGHDPIDECLRLIRSARHHRADSIARALAAGYTELAPADRTSLIEHLGPDAPRIITQLVRAPEPEIRIAGIDLARDLADTCSIPAILPLVEDDQPDVAQAAGGAVLELAERFASTRQQTRADATGIDARLVSSIFVACDRFPDHRVAEVVDAAVLVLDPPIRRGELGPEIAGWLGSTDQAVRLALRAAIRRSPGPLGRLRAWELLDEPEFRQPAIDRLVSSQPDDALALTIASAHLGLRPVRRHAIRARVRPAQIHHLLPDSDHFASCSDAARRGYPLWIDSVNPSASIIESALECCLNDPDPAVRFAAMRLAPPGLVRDFAFDADQAIATSAIRRLLRLERDELDPSLVDALKRSPHEAVRRLASATDAGPMASVSLRRLLASDRDRALGLIRTRLESQQERDVLGAVTLIGRLGLERELTHDLLGLLDRAFRRNDSPSWRVIASVMGILPELPHPSVAKLLAVGRAHTDARVRANAIEAEPRRPSAKASTMVELITPACDDTNHRVRTSAMRVLLRSGCPPEDTVDRVLGTLADDNPTARAAALWLVERSVVELRPVAGPRWADLAARIAEIARGGDQPSERARATRCARRMLAEMRPNPAAQDEPRAQGRVRRHRVSKVHV